MPSASFCAGANSLGAPVTRVPSLDKRWQELQDLLRREWDELTQTVESSMQDTFQRQELLMNQYGAGTNDWGQDRADAPNEATPVSQVHPTTLVTVQDVALAPSESHTPHARSLHLHWDDSPSLCLTPPHQHGSEGRAGPDDLKSDKASTSLAQRISGISLATSALGFTDREKAAVAPAPVAPVDVVKNSNKSAQSKLFPTSTCEEVDKQVYEKQRVTAMNIWEMRRVCGEGVWAVFGPLLEWWFELDPPDLPKNSLARFAFGEPFSLLSTLILGIDTTMMILATDREAKTFTPNRLASQLNLGFTAFYLIEMVLKVAVRRQWFFCDDNMGWNIFDFCLAVVGVVDVLLADVWQPSLRPARVLRMMRFVRYFSQLKRILTSLIVSSFSLFWSIIMLMFLFAMFATVFVQSSTAVLADPNRNLTEEQRLLLTSRFGHVWTAMVTLFKAATGGDSWSGFYESIQLTGSFHAALFLFFVAFAQFALLNVIMGMFVVSAMKLATPDRETVALEQRKADMEQAKEMMSLVSNLDKDETGRITEEMFLQEFQDDQFKARLALLDLDIKKAKAFFEMICDGVPANDVPVELFVTRAMRLKGLATSLDMETLLFGTQAIFENQILFQNALEETLQRVLHALDRSQWNGRGTSPCHDRNSQKN